MKTHARRCSKLTFRACALLALCGGAAVAHTRQDTPAQSVPTQTTPAQPQTPVRRVPVAPKPKAPAPTPAEVSPSDGTSKPAPGPKPAMSEVAPNKPVSQRPTYAPTPKLGAFLSFKQPKDYYLSVNIDVVAEKPKRILVTPDKKAVVVRDMQEFEFDGMSVIFPYVLSTASAQLLGETKPWPQGDDGEDGFKGRLKMNDIIVDDEPEILKGYPAGTRLAKWICTPSADHPAIREIDLDVRLPVRCSETILDEVAAMEVPWPKVWPEDAATALLPQLFVEKGIDADGKIKDYDATKIADALAKYLAEEKLDTAQSVNPAKIAKILAGKVLRDVQESGSGLKIQQRTRRISAMEITPPAFTLNRGRGSAQDMTALLAALYREAGLPVRTVLAIEASPDTAKGIVAKVNQSDLIRSFCEFALYDEGSKSMNWIPVDIARMKKQYGRPPKMDQPWKYFGTHDELNAMIPFALQFHPPTDVACYEDPLFWGWFVTPQTPKVADQSISFSVNSVPRRQDGGLRPATPKEATPAAEGSVRRGVPKPEESDRGRSNK